MKQRGTVTTALVCAGSLLLALAAGAQQEIIDPQPQGAEHPSPPSPPPAPAPAPPPEAQAPEQPEAPAPPALPLSTSKPAQQGTLLSSSALVGATVRSTQGEELGTIQELMVDPQSGRIARAVVTFGGVLGLNAQRVDIPWETLKIGLRQEELVVEMDKERLPLAPGAEPNPPPASD
jgi:sporulation protein YlmC with PRC-barrel domain